MTVAPGNLHMERQFNFACQRRDVCDVISVGHGGAGEEETTRKNEPTTKPFAGVDACLRAADSRRLNV